MSKAVEAWVDLNRDAQRLCNEALARVIAAGKDDAFAKVCGAFLSKATETLTAVNVLYANSLAEPAQALIRILFELRVNFDCFLTLARQDMKKAVMRVADSMMLEKVKQAKAADFAGVPTEVRRLIEASEAEITSRYSEEELARLRRHGFTGLPIEQRAALTGHDEAYNIAYRNFSRNIHSTDYVESYLKIGAYAISGEDSYRESRDVAAHYTAHFSAVGIVELSNHVFGLGLNGEINSLGDRQRAVKDIPPIDSNTATT